MTEADHWLTDDSEWVIGCAGAELSHRRLLLIACGCCRSSWGLLVDERSRRAVEVAEHLADGCATDEQVARAVWDAEAATFRLGDRAERAAREQRGIREGWLIAEDASFDEHAAHSERGPISYPLATAVASAVDSIFSLNAGDFERLLVPIFSLDVFRDVIRNPFLPMTFSPEWRTDTAVSLACGMYESRDFSAMPILADAIQDAGCDSDDILNHCRDTNATHVRGCWVVDLLLGK